MELSRILINDIKNRRILWDKQHLGYHDRVLVDTEWDKVAANTNLKKEAVKSRWKNLRDSFRKELKRIPFNYEIGTCDFSLYTGTWPYFDDMLFLSNILKIKSDNIYSSASPSPVSQEIDIFENDSILDADGTENIHILQEDCTPSNVTKKFSRKRKINNDEVESSISDESLQRLEDDEDLNFFKSMIPHVKKLPSLQKLQFRSQVQNILADQLSQFRKLHNCNYLEDNENEIESINFDE